MYSKGKKIVYITHCVDVEGPMNETVEATWERILLEDDLLIVQEPTAENLKKLQKGELDINVSSKIKDYLASKYCKQNLSYLKSWDELDSALNKIITPSFRQKYSDSQGNPYNFNWFIYDHFGFLNNPRYHAEGVHAIFDHYQKLFLSDNAFNDGVYWHYHHVPASGDALEWNPNWFMNGVYEEILARRIIERNWFPSVFRAGGHIERNDLSYWLEMFIPFDFSCRTPKWLVKPQGRASVNDWRYAPREWGYYNPDWYDYRRPGNMKRSLFRCLDLRTWITAIKRNDVREAFERADAGYDTVLAYYNHDYRDMSDDIDYVYNLLTEVAQEFPEVTWVFSNCLDAARPVTGFDEKDRKPRFDYHIENAVLTINSDIELFGPEPFLAIKENGKFFRDNTTREGPREWCYEFRCPKDVEAFGIAANSPGGETTVVVHNGGLSQTK